MLDTLYIETVEQADALLKPKRVEVLRQLAEPRTCTQIGQVLGDTPQAVYYHVKRLQAARAGGARLRAPGARDHRGRVPLGGALVLGLPHDRRPAR